LKTAGALEVCTSLPVGTLRAVAFVPATTKGTIMSAIVLWIIALVVGIVGIVQLFQGQIILGVVLIIAAFLIGPGGYSIFRSRSHA
jgi:hypothetical protein